MKLWRNAQAGRSVDGILYGLVQLVLDVLETTCDDEDSNDDFTLPANIDGTTLGNFIVRVMNGKVSKKDEQIFVVIAFQLHNNLFCPYFCHVNRISM